MPIRRRREADARTESAHCPSARDQGNMAVKRHAVPAAFERQDSYCVKNPLTRLRPQAILEEPAELSRQDSCASVSSDISTSGSNRGSKLWRQLSLSRVNDAAAYLRQSSTPESPEVTRLSDAQIARVSLRLDGMDSYGVLGALIAGFSLQLVSAVSWEEFNAQSGLLIWLASVGFTMCGTLTAAFALFATLIFALNSLHG